jgi:hypothetical protein
MLMVSVVAIDMKKKAVSFMNPLCAARRLY